MPIYKIKDNELTALSRTTFANQGIREVQHLQQLLKAKIEVISPDTLIVAEEFSDWKDSKRRIDLLGIDKEANLVVIELKRTEDGGFMDLQAIRYASMISTLTFKKLEEIYGKYLHDNDIKTDPTESLLEFLDWPEPDEDNFAQEVKIVLASAEFSKELTTSVMWLRDLDLDIRCVRMQPYESEDETLLDIQTVVPIPEAADYQIRIQEKKLTQRAARSNARDFTKYNVTIGADLNKGQSKRWTIFYVIKGIFNSGGSPSAIMESIPHQKNRLFLSFDGILDHEAVQRLIMKDDPGGKYPRIKRYFCNEGEIFHFDNSTWVLTNQWGRRTEEIVDELSNSFPALGIRIEAVEDFS